MKKIILILILLLLIGCSPETQEEKPAYSGGGCGVQEQSQQISYCMINNDGLCVFQEGL